MQRKLIVQADHEYFGQIREEISCGKRYYVIASGLHNFPKIAHGCCLSMKRCQNKLLLVSGNRRTGAAFSDCQT